MGFFFFFWTSFWIFGCLPGGRALSRGDGGAICYRFANIWEDIGLGVGGSAERGLRTSSAWSRYLGAVKKSLIAKKHSKCITDLCHHFWGIALAYFGYLAFLLDIAIYFGTDVLHARASVLSSQFWIRCNDFGLFSFFVVRPFFWDIPRSKIIQVSDFHVDLWKRM